MAKVAFTKLGLTKNQAIKTIKYNEQEIEVKQYLPVNEKLKLISSAINLSVDENNFVNSLKLNVLLTLDIIDYYTNINFTEKQREDPSKLYDLLEGNGINTLIINAIPEDEVEIIMYNACKIAENIYKYKTSALGIMESISQDYSALDLDTTEIQQKLADPDNLTLLKQVMTKLG